MVLADFLFQFPGTLFLIIILYGLGAIPFSYLISFLAKSQAGGFTICIMINILSGNIFII